MFWSSDFEGFGIGMVGYSYGFNHSKTKPFKMAAILFGFQMVLDKMANILSTIQNMNAIQYPYEFNHLNPECIQLKIRDNLCNIKLFWGDGSQLVEEVLSDGVLEGELDQEVVDTLTELVWAHEALHHSDDGGALRVRDHVEDRVDLEAISEFS